MSTITCRAWPLWLALSCCRHGQNVPLLLTLALAMFTGCWLMGCWPMRLPRVEKHFHTGFASCTYTIL